jgi:serine/threonine protein kinase
LKKQYERWEECLELSEVKVLRRIIHPNIIKLKEVVRVMNDAYLVFEYAEKDLYKLMSGRKEKGKKLHDN